jgi:hypothetical protein
VNSFRITEPGMFFDVPCEAYFADPCPRPSLNNSLIDTLLFRTPMHAAALHPRLNGGEEIVRKETDAMCLGSVVHRLALGAGKDYVVIDAENYRTADARAKRDHAQENGFCPILAHNYETASALAPRLREHLDEMLLGEPFLPEVVIAWQIDTPHGKVWARGMVDAWCPTLNMAVDLKTWTDASASAVEKKVAREGYDTQAAWYTRGLEFLTDQPGKIRFAYLVGEKEAPHASQPFELDEAWRSSAWDLCEEAVEIFARCLKASHWPGYQRNPVLLSPPDWLIRERMFRGFTRDGHDKLDDSPFTTTDEEITYGDATRALVPGE